MIRTTVTNQMQTQDVTVSQYKHIVALMGDVKGHATRLDTSWHAES